MQVRAAQPIATRDKPATDRRAVFVSIENESATLDLLIAQQNDKFGQLRCIYIDTSAQDSSGDGCTIETDIGQKITALANTQGYYPVFVPFVTKLTISSNEAVTLLMLDFDMRPVTWATVLQSGSVPDPLHVIIDDQPIATNATVENWPAVQPVSISGQPIATDATVQNWPAVQPVSISGQPIATDATVQNWPAVQPVSISGQPIATDATVQNWPAVQPVSISGQPIATNATIQNMPPVGNGSLVSLVLLSTTLQAISTPNHILSYISFIFFAASMTAPFNISFYDSASTLVYLFSFPSLSNYSGSFGFPINRVSPLAISAQLSSAPTGGGISCAVVRI